jgi:hypothetical protein
MRYRDRTVVVFEPRRTVSREEVEAVAARLRVRFPDGYAEYMTELGEGTLSNDIRLWPPRQVEANLAEFRRLLADVFQYRDAGPLTPERVRESIILGDTITGDWLLFHPERPDDLFVLPRHDDQVYQIGPGLEAAIDWLCDSGVLQRPAQLRFFEPKGERERLTRAIPLPYETVRDAVLALGLHDHVAWEEPDEGEEPVFTAIIMAGNDDEEGEEVNADDASIMLLIPDLGGGVMIANGSPFGPPTAEVSIEYVAGCDRTKLDRLIACLDELAPRGRRPKRRGR